MTIFEIDYKNDHKIINILGIKIKVNHSIYNKIHKKFKKNKNFNCKKFDDEIAKITNKVTKNYMFNKNPINSNKIAIFATLFADMGGHTECVKNLVKPLSDKYEITTFLTKKDLSYSYANKKIKQIEKFSRIDGCNASDKVNEVEKLISIFDKINKYSPKVLFVYMHTDDCFGAGLLYLLKKFTDIKIIYINHASHYPALGLTFANEVSYSFDSILNVNINNRKVKHNVYLNLIDEKKENIVNISDSEKKYIRNSLGIHDNQFFTLSGASSYKFFENGTSEYFKMIKFLLEHETNLKHVVITELSNKEDKIVKKIFKNSNTLGRLKIINFTSDYSKYFQSCDLFIDSFPVSSALAHIELMKHKKVSVLKINDKNILYNFYEYFPQDYQYMLKNMLKVEKKFTSQEVSF